MGNGATVAAGAKAPTRKTKAQVQDGIALFRWLTRNWVWDGFILLCIVGNAAILGYDAHFGEVGPYHGLIEQWNMYFLWIFTAELAMEFLAFGVSQKPGDARDHFRMPFVARGLVREHLGAFIARMQREGAQVEFHSRPPLRSLEEYVARHFPSAFEDGPASRAMRTEAGGTARHEAHA